MKHIYIILTSSNTVPDRLIKRLTNFRYGHVALSMNRDCKTVYSFGRRKPRNPFNGGFVIEQQDGPFYKLFNETECLIYELPVSEEQYLKLNCILDTIAYHGHSYNYDFLGIVLRYFHIPVSFKKKYVCSFFIARLLRCAGIYEFSIPDFYVRPEHFTLIPDATVIYQGKYTDYRVQ